MTFIVDISVNSTQWPALDNIINNVAMKTMEELKLKGSAELSVVLSDSAAVQRLNRDWRGKDKPTNVLSFPAGEPGMLGDVVLAYEIVKQEAEEQKKSFDHHLMHLIIHGILHLVGHDHEDDKEAENMESLEIRILRSFGVKNPYEL